ncbi:MAG: class I SAM-dependent methyltransferase [Saprospiraceae bacterium]|nr:class I SAM-dependent methyltransferase [Saprospiraceae bacterium]
MPVYDTIGKTYDKTRKADPYLASRMFHFLHNGQSNAQYLDIGSGSGNYTSALAAKGLSMIGVEPSDEMLEKAMAKSNEVKWMKGRAEQIPLPDEAVDGVLASLTIHHWKDLEQGFKEVHRVLKPGGRFVLFTSYPEQTDAYWLAHYFPRLTRASAIALPAQNLVESGITQAGLQLVLKEPYFVKADLEDFFFYSGKYRPQMYFDENVRRGISTFSLLAHQDEVNEGLSKLKTDIDNGHIENIIKQYENEIGDYIFVISQKPI